MKPRIIRDKRIFMNTEIEFVAWTDKDRRNAYKIFNEGFDHSAKL